LELQQYPCRGQQIETESEGGEEDSETEEEPNRGRRGPGRKRLRIETESEGEEENDVTAEKQSAFPKQFSHNQFDNKLERLEMDFEMRLYKSVHWIWGSRAAILPWVQRWIRYRAVFQAIVAMVCEHGGTEFLYDKILQEVKDQHTLSIKSRRIVYECPSSLIHQIETGRTEPLSFLEHSALTVCEINRADVFKGALLYADDETVHEASTRLLVGIIRDAFPQKNESSSGFFEALLDGRLALKGEDWGLPHVTGPLELILDIVAGEASRL